MNAADASLPPIDRELFEALAGQIGPLIRAHLKIKPYSPSRTLEVLNVLAGYAAHIIAGTEHDPRAIAFFFEAFMEEHMGGGGPAIRVEAIDGVEHSVNIRLPTGSIH